MPPSLCLGTFLVLLLGLPPFGLLLSGYSFPAHLALIPILTEPGESSISWLTWGVGCLLITATISPFIWRHFGHFIPRKYESLYPANFPWWGWIALLLVIGSWVLAWTRFAWFSPWQPHTFPLLWLGFIITLNALTYRRSGHCLLLNGSGRLGQFFLLSAGFWWTFEYLNQFVENWHYVNLPEMSRREYFFYTSLAFSTVLPAVLSTYEWLTTFPRLTQPFENWHSLPWMFRQRTGWILFGSGSMGLGLIGIWPSVLFPLLWLSPLCLLLGLQIIKTGKTSFSSLAHGDWRPVVLSAMASLLCGFWWELWNVYSLVHWEYTIPYVQTLKIFEMPILGYAGYLPFGLLCLAITEVGLGYRTNHPLIGESQTWRDNAP